MSTTTVSGEGQNAEVEVWVERNHDLLTPEMRQFARAISLEASFDDSASNPAVLQIMQNILTAEGEDEIFAAANAGTTAGKEYVDKPFLLKQDDIHWKKSGAMFAEQGGFPFYALMNVTDLETGEYPRVINCGGYTFLTTMWKLAQGRILGQYEDKGGMPLIIRGKPASQGVVLIPQKFIMPKTPNGKKA